MKRSLKLKKDEKLSDWISRIAKNYGFSDEIKEVLREISVKSYIHGTNDAVDVLNVTPDKRTIIINNLERIKAQIEYIKSVL